MSRCMFGVLAESNRLWACWQGDLVCVSPSLVIMTKSLQCEHIFNATHTLLKQSEKQGSVPTSSCSVSLCSHLHLCLYACFCLYVSVFCHNGSKEMEMEPQSSTPEDWRHRTTREKAEQRYKGKKISPSPDLWSFNMGWAPDNSDLRYCLYHPLCSKTFFVDHKSYHKRNHRKYLEVKNSPIQ